MVRSDSTGAPELQSLATLGAVSTVSAPEIPSSLRNEDPLHTSSGPCSEKTLLYLAYGSNLAAEAFRKRRNIHPLQAINVIVPSLELVFDLSGIAYVEPCFANTRRRSEAPADSSDNSEKTRLLGSSSYIQTAHNLGWKKGLVGVVYEVTESDFARIIATEGGGSSYADIEVACYPLGKDLDKVPSEPEGTPLIAHTLFADPSKGRNGSARRDGWAQPSPRYLGLLSSGAAEHNLPTDYQKWLQQLRGYRITTWRQTAGKIAFLTTWAPFAVVLFTLQRLLVDKHGKAPKWLAALAVKFFAVMWASYDYGFKKVFGEGERTIGDPLAA